MTLAEKARVETVGALLGEAAQRLAAAGVEQPRLDARLLLAAVLGVAPQALALDPTRPLQGEAIESFRALVERRRRREPVSRILGRREFWSLPFALSPHTLDPRPDSEALIEAALARLEDRTAPLNILDLGAGSGCLLLALLHELPAARGLAVDRDPLALATARANAETLGLAERTSFVASDWGAALSGRWDVILSNPPYVARDALSGLEPEVARFDPRGALDGGPDGLDAYRALGTGLGQLLTQRGFAALEIGAGQGPDVKAILETAGLALLGAASDLAGRERCLLVGLR